MADEGFVSKGSQGRLDPTAESLEALRQVERDTQSIAGSPLPGVERRVVGVDARDAFDASGTDPIEVWGRRIGRVLSVVLAVALTWWLAAQLGWL